MMMYQKAIVRRPVSAGVDGYEGCFVTINAAGAVSLATANTVAGDVYGILNSTTDKVGEDVSVALPGCDGIFAAQVHASSAAVTDGAKLFLAASGKVTMGTTGTVVAVALEAANAGDMVAVRLVEPYAVTAGA